MSRLPRLLRYLPLFGRQRRAYVETLPEAALFPEEALRDEAIDDTRRFVERHWLFKVVLSGLAFAVFVGLFYALASLLGRTIWAPVIAGLIAVVTLEPLWYLTLRHRASRELRRRLNEIGIEVCERCGYDLRARPAGAEPVCPECGAVIVSRPSNATAGPADSPGRGRGAARR